jgi:hypothetical protein
MTPGASLHERRDKLAALLAAKLEQGYWVELQRDTDAVVVCRGRHRWFGRLGPRRENRREAVSVDADGQAAVRVLPERRY